MDNKFPNRIKPAPKIPDVISDKITFIENELTDIKTCLDNYDAYINTSILVNDCPNVIFIEEKVILLQDKIINTIYDYREQLDIFNNYLASIELEYAAMADNPSVTLLLLLSRIINIKSEISNISNQIKWLDDHYNFLNNKVLEVISGNDVFINNHITESLELLKQKSEKVKSSANYVQEISLNLEQFKKMNESISKLFN